MKKTIQLKISFVTLAFSLPLAVVAGDSPQMGSMTRGLVMTTNAMQMNDMPPKTMNGTASPMNGLATNSMMGMSSNSMMSPPAMGNRPSNSMVTSNKPAMNRMDSGGMGMTNTPQMNNTNSMNMARPTAGH